MQTAHKPVVALTIAMAGLFCTGSAMARQSTQKPTRDEAKEIFKPDPLLNKHKPELLEQGGGPKGDAAWSVVIASVAEGDSPKEAEKLAQEALERVQTKGGLGDAFLEKRNKAWVILFGKYDAPDAPNAKNDLARIHDIAIEGKKPFSDAYLCPPSGDALRGNIPDFDLRNARKLYGKARAVYTLQVGIYGRDDRAAPEAQELKEFREAAEKAAVQLRREGEMAFYFHGPERSTVTVGLFTPDDIDPKKKGAMAGANVMALADARLRHPYNLLNGKGIKEKISNPDSKAEAQFQMQKTMLVAVPD